MAVADGGLRAARRAPSTRSSALSSDQKLGLTYYDATRVYEQIADYTGNAVWDDCATKAKAIYRGYVIRNNGNVPGYWNFTSGFRMDWERNSDAMSKQAAILLSQNAAFCTDATPLEWTLSLPTAAGRSPTASCPTSNAEDLGEPRRARLTTLADQALGHIDQWFVSKTSRAPQTFSPSRRQPGSTTSSRSWSGSPCRR